MKTGPVLSAGQLKDGYMKTLENAARFFAAASDLIKSYPDKAFALAQIGQEEVGRSLTILAGFALLPDVDAWKWFWGGWWNHQLKAHRACLYEIIDPLRIEILVPDGPNFAGHPLRPNIAQEKEAGFYVDFNLDTGCFLAPMEQVSNFEASGRTITLMYLFATADAVRRALLVEDDQFRLPAFGELAFKICSEDIYQQDWPELIDEFGKRSLRHEALVDSLNVALSTNKTLFYSLDQSEQGKATHATPE